MKRLFYLVVIIVLPLLLFFQWRKYRRFNPPTDYTYTVNDSIDPNYHDPERVLDYYQSAEATATFARYCWRKKGIDVRHPDLDDPEEALAVKTYQQHVAATQAIEQKLIQSANWKKSGMSNRDIKSIEQSGMTESQHKHSQILGEAGVIRMGDEGPGVWHIQRLLIQKGYEIRLDGIFDQETLEALNSFQSQNDRRQTFGVDQEILTALMKN